MSFVPLRDNVGLSVRDFLRSQNDKAIVVWGSGFLGKCLCRRFVKVRFNNFFFTDSFKGPDPSDFMGRGFISAQHAIEMARTGAATILISVQPTPQALKQHLLAAGLTDGINFLSIQKLSRRSPTIEIFDPISQSSMSQEHAKLIAEKICKDYLDVFQLDLSSNGYSFHNPEVIRIAQIFEEVAPCTVSFKLSEIPIEQIRECIGVGVSQIVCLVDDCAPNRALTLLRHLSSVYRESRDSKLRTEVRVRFDVFENNSDSLDELRAYCSHLGLPFVVALGYPSYYDSIVLKEAGTNLFVQPSEPIAWSFSEAKSLAMQDKGNHCLCERVFPVVNASGAARLCHLYTTAVVHPDYLSISREDLHSGRAEATHCRTCQSQGLHRLDVAVLERRHNVRITSDTYKKVSQGK